MMHFPVNNTASFTLSFYRELLRRAIESGIVTLTMRRRRKRASNAPVPERQTPSLTSHAHNSHYNRNHVDYTNANTASSIAKCRSASSDGLSFGSGKLTSGVDDGGGGASVAHCHVLRQGHRSLDDEMGAHPDDLELYPDAMTLHDANLDLNISSDDVFVDSTSVDHLSYTNYHKSDHHHAYNPHQVFPQPRCVPENDNNIIIKNAHSPPSIQPHEKHLNYNSNTGQSPRRLNDPNRTSTKFQNQIQRSQGQGQIMTSFTTNSGNNGIESTTSGSLERLNGRRHNLATFYHSGSPQHGHASGLGCRTEDGEVTSAGCPKTEADRRQSSTSTLVDGDIEEEDVNKGSADSRSRVGSLDSLTYVFGNTGADGQNLAHKQGYHLSTSGATKTGFVKVNGEDFPRQPLDYLQKYRIDTSSPAVCQLSSFCSPTERNYPTIASPLSKVKEC